jgi:hypothetical protein
MNSKKICSLALLITALYGATLRATHNETLMMRVAAYYQNRNIGMITIEVDKSETLGTIKEKLIAAAQERLSSQFATNITITPDQIQLFANNNEQLTGHDVPISQLLRANGPLTIEGNTLKSANNQPIMVKIRIPQPSSASESKYHSSKR